MARSHGTNPTLCGATLESSMPYVGDRDARSLVVDASTLKDVLASAAANCGSPQLSKWYDRLFCAPPPTPC
jgi:hypothetical protein